MTGRVASCGVMLWWAAACQGGVGSSPRPFSESLPQGIAASVSGDEIATTWVERIAERQSLPPAAARDRAIQDALFAAEGRHLLAQEPWLRTAQSAVLAAAVVEQLSEQARAPGPPSDIEIAQATERRWLEFDRPAAARTVHAVVVVKDPAADAPARRVADRIANAVRGIQKPDEFMARAREVPRGTLELRAEEVPPVASDGRQVDPAQPPGRESRRFDEAFARAANALARSGDQSPVVRSAFGYHVIMLIERTEEHRVSLPDRRRQLEADVLLERGTRLLEEMVERLRAAERVEILPAAMELAAGVTSAHEP